MFNLVDKKRKEMVVGSISRTKRERSLVRVEELQQKDLLISVSKELLKQER